MVLDIVPHAAVSRPWTWVGKTPKPANQLLPVSTGFWPYSRETYPPGPLSQANVPLWIVSGNTHDLPGITHALSGITHRMFSFPLFFQWVISRFRALTLS